MAMGSVGAAADRRLSDELIRRIGERARTVSSDANLQIVIMALAMWGTPEIETKMLEELRPTLSRPAAIGFLDGALRKLRGDERGAAKAWRPLIVGAGIEDVIPTDSFAAVGDYETALRLTEEGGTNKDDNEYAGHPWQAPLTARYLYLKGDKARARELSQTVLTDSSAADIEVPALEDMRRIVAGRPLR